MYAVNAIRNWAFWVILTLAFYYQTYRYPLGYGIEPPLIWRLGKYILCTGVALSVVPSLFKKHDLRNHFDWLFPLVFLIAGCVGIFQRDKFLLQLGFGGFVGFIIVISINGKIAYQTLLKFLMVCFALNIAFVTVQFIGLVFFDKKFVWATSSVLTSRFGGLLVEPLGAAYLSFVFMGLSLEFLGIKRWLLFTLALLCLLMTHTLTGYLYIALVGSVIVAISLRDRYGKLVAYFFLNLWFSLVAFGIYMIWVLQDTDTYFTAKWLSITTHLSYWWPVRWSWFPEKESAFSESWMSFAIQNMGILLAFVYFSLMFVLFLDCAKEGKKLLRPRADGTFRGIFVGMYLSGLFVILGSFNQLYPAMYPVGLLSMLFALLIKYEKISETVA